MSENVRSTFEAVRASGKQAVIFENGWGPESMSFIGIVNPKIRVPAGEKGLLFIDDFLRSHRQKKGSGSFFNKGFAGFLSYELGAKWMGIKSGGNRGKNICPEAFFVFVDEIIPIARKIVKSQQKPKTKQIPEIKSNLKKSQYLGKLKIIKQRLYAGETYQVNFSQKFAVPFSGDAFSLYERTAEINPSPFQFFLETPDFAIISNSPERLFILKQAPHGARRADGFAKSHPRDTLIIETRPIKGTLPRGKNSREDGKNIKKLLASAKEKAELEMIVDLERNDLGKICMPGTVKVTENRTIEKYSHVIHTVSNVRGTLNERENWLSALHALFPGGSVTGCPKKRTMEIINELEAGPRGIYCGSAGFIDISGRCDFNIMIRTFFLEKGRGSGKLTFHSGGGIVVDSDPEREYEETLHKSQALLSTIAKII